MTDTAPEHERVTFHVPSDSRWTLASAGGSTAKPNGSAHWARCVTYARATATEAAAAAPAKTAHVADATPSWTRVRFCPNSLLSRRIADY